MAKSITIVFPHQLFKQHPAIFSGGTVWLMEETRFFVDYRYHKKKLVMHRASMKYYQDYLRKQGYHIRYFDYMDVNGEQILSNLFKKENITDVHIGDVYDSEVKQLYQKVCANVGASCTWYETPMFMTDTKSRRLYWAESRFHRVDDFYTWQGKRFDFLAESSTSHNTIEPDNKVEPFGLRESTYTKEAKKYVDEYFAENYGATAGFVYAVSHEDAEAALMYYLEHADTTSQGVVRAALNIGLLEPADVVERTLEFVQKKNIKIATFKSLLTYVVSTREFMYVLYEQKGEQLREQNVYAHRRMIPRSWYLGKTDIAPVDSIIRKILRTAYADDIDRLEILQSAMLFSEFDPDHMHQWFMEFSIDMYDWVAVPTVYGREEHMRMSSAYVLDTRGLVKMGAYKKDTWCEMWDALYWHFVATHIDALRQNNLLSDAIPTYQEKSPTEKKTITQDAEKYFSTLGVSAYT